MANEVTMRNGKEILEVEKPTFEGVTALEELGWKIAAGKKPVRIKSAPAVEPVNAEALRAELEAEIRAELAAEAEKTPVKK